MLVLAENWENTDYIGLKETLVKELFEGDISDSIALAKSSGGSLTQKDIAGITMYIDQWISNYTAENSEPLFWYRGDTARSYICTATVLPTGSVVVSFIAKLHGVADPVRLEFIY